MTESCFFKSNIWSSSVTLDKPKVTKGICHPQNSSNTFYWSIHRRNCTFL